MRKSLLLVAVWLLAGAGALAAATVGVSTVGNQVTGDRPAPLSAAQVREELQAAATSSPTTSTSVSATTSTLPGATTTAAPTTVPPGGGFPTTTTTAGGAAAAAGSSEDSEVRTYSVVGGTATLRFTPSGVTVVAATPDPGFAVSIEAEESNGIKVEFENDDVRSRVTGWWDGGPRDEVREDDDD